MIAKTDKLENSFDIRLLSKLFSASVFLFMLTVIPVYADNWCQRFDEGIAPCTNNIVPNGWNRCGTFNRQAIWCHPSTNGNDVSGNNTKPSYIFYTGLSLGYTASINGGITADYANQPDAFMVLGSFQQSAFQINGTRVVPIQISLGVNVIDNLRADISHMRYSGISIPGAVQQSAAFFGFYYAAANGGDVSGNTTMLNVYYNLDRLTGRFIAGKLSPYVGIGIGLGINTISDYMISIPGYYELPPGSTTGISNIRALHSGSTTRNLAYMIETGGTSELTDRVLLDMFVRWTNLGCVRTSGNIVVTQTKWDNGIPSVVDNRDNYQNWRESGTLSILDIGARLRLLF